MSCENRASKGFVETLLGEPGEAAAIDAV